MVLRWGIVSAGKASHDFTCSLKSLPPNNHQVVAIGAISFSNAEIFAEIHNIPKAYEGYLKIAEDEDVDIVYIGNINSQHFDAAKLMLNHGKNVLCENHFTMTETQTRILINLARSKKLFVAEGIWSRSFPVYTELYKLIRSNAIGEVLQVQASLGFDLKTIDRFKLRELGSGTILDLGVHVLQFQQFVYRDMKPDKVFSSGILNCEGTDNSVTALISYYGGQTALVTTSALALYPNEGVIVGTKGIIRIPEFWCPTKIFVNDVLFEFPLPISSETFYFLNSVGLCYQAEFDRQLIESGKIENPNITHQETIQLARLIDTVRKQVGVVFPEYFEE